MRLKINRFKEINDTTLGKFELYDDQKNMVLKGYTLEPAGDDCVERGLDRRIPKGIYKTTPHNSPRFKEELPLLYNNLVPPDRYILIHCGNYGDDTEGCILVGSNWDNNGVYNSRATLKKLLELTKGKKLEVSISNKELYDDR